ncbi:pyridoxal phosphate-dependent aminotransferase [Candidatus Aerophobetes bacterium]|uniref:Aminotransferase n=1 Tax=Aerophobetes bacterium TaxID=2030807 RepID=A0A523V0C8_UNCAE|nr:MAG: pyridoxal phosphate-dependent aminotransferase [Candidatus Aerophobetes bacterium]
MLSQRLSRVAPSATLAISARAKEMLREGRKVVNLSVGEPDFDTPSFIKEAAIQALKEGFTKYTPVAGIPELIQAIREKLERDNNLSYSNSQIMVSSGAKEVLYNAFQAICNQGDEVIIPSPYWVSYPEQVKLAGGIPVFISLDFQRGMRLERKRLGQVISPRTKALILNSPHNPTGGVFSLEELKEIAEFAVTQDFLIITDEIYEKLIYEGTHVSIASLGKEIEKKTITINGVSKTYSMTGWRIGYAAGPQEVIEGMKKIQSQSTSCANSIAQKAAVEALLGPQDDVEKARREFEKRCQVMMDRLSRIEGITCPKPQGAFYVFPNISSFLGTHDGDWIIRNSVDLAKYLLERAEVATVPGSAFGADNHLRLSYATSLDQIHEGLDRIKEALGNLKG